MTRRADAAEAQLDEGLAFLRAELTKLARLVPNQAERLRIPGERRNDRRSSQRGD